MSFNRLSQTVLEVGKGKSKLTIDPFGSKPMQHILSVVDLKDITKTPPHYVSELMAQHIISMEGIDGDITEHTLLEEIKLNVFYAILGEMVKNGVATEEQSKNSDSLSESPTEAASEPTKTAE